MEGADEITVSTLVVVHWRQAHPLFCTISVIREDARA